MIISDMAEFKADVGQTLTGSIIAGRLGDALIDDDRGAVTLDRQARYNHTNKITMSLITIISQQTKG
jgi:hypothetical protein